MTHHILDHFDIDALRERNDAALIDGTRLDYRALTRIDRKGISQDSIDEAAAMEKLLSGMSIHARKQFTTRVLKALDATVIEELTDALVAMDGGRS